MVEIERLMFFVLITNIENLTLMLEIHGGKCHNLS